MANPENRDPIGRTPTSTTPGPEGAGPRTTEEEVIFRCSDIHVTCNWEARGRDESELRPQIEQHGREHHGIREFGEDIWNRVRAAIHRRAA
ncbi:MAG TPA: DUF1059 domain-containing protein [Terriglobales bacterium]|nr:DUF1059 domain-containing protein [Terriglobales bacterium]